MNPFTIALSCFVVLTLAACVKEPAAVLPQVHYPGYHAQRTGTAARDLLSDERFDALTVEIQYMPGFRPEEETIRALNDFLHQHLHKPKGIDIVLTETRASQKEALSIKELLCIENSHRKTFAVNRTNSVFVFFTNGSHPDSKILGMAYRNTSVVVYGGSINNNSGLSKILTKAELETTVLLHETGHLLNLGNDTASVASLSSGREKRQHCQNELCLMYWSTETRNLSAINRKGKVPQLDVHCRKLLLANGGKDGLSP